MKRAMRRKRFSAVALVLASMLTACSAATDSSQPGREGKSTEEAPKEPVKLVIVATAADFTEDRFMEVFGSRIQSKLPHVTIEFIPKGLPDTVVNGQTFDILFASVGHSFNLRQYELQYDMSALIKEQRFDLDRFEPATINIQRNFSGGGIYGVPITNQSLALFYNKDLFDKFGVKYPADGMTWDETFELAKTMSRTEGGQSYRGFGYSFSHQIRANQLSLPLVDPSTFRVSYGEAAKRLVGNFARFYQIPGNEATSETISNAVQQKMFVETRNLAMYSHLSEAAVKAFPDDLNWDVVSLPYFSKDMKTGSQSYPTYFYITEHSKHKEAALDVIRAVTSDDMQRELSELGLMSPLSDKSVQQVYGKQLKSFQGKNIAAFFPARFAETPSLTEFDTRAEGQLNGALNKVVINGVDLNTALREGEETANKLIAEQRAK